MATILKSTRPPFGKGHKLRMALRIMIKIVDIPIQEQKREGAVHSTSWLSRGMLLVVMLEVVSTNTFKHLSVVLFSRDAKLATLNHDFKRW